MLFKTTAVVFCLLILMSVNLMAQKPWVKDFLTVYNSNDPAKIKPHLTENFHKAYHNTTKYWQGVFKEFGSVTYFSMDRDSVNGRPLIWVRSEKTRNFVGFAYKLSTKEEFQITRMGVIRGMIPSGIVQKSMNPKEAKSEILSYLEELGRGDLFSGVVLIARGDEIILNHAINLADRENSILNTVDTKFLIASTTKMFTTVAIAQLVEQGFLSYDDPISKYLQDYPKHIGSKVTIHHLLSHSSGIELDEISAYNKGAIKIKTLEELYQLHLKHLPKLKNYANFELPDGYNYTNEGFDLAGYIVEKITGQSYYDYVQENIFERAAMSNTGDFEIDRVIPNLAKGYRVSNSGSRRLNTKQLPARSRPAGSFYSTPKDLFLFIRALQKESFVGKEAFENMIRAKTTAYANSISESRYGYGFTLNNVAGVKSWGHAGVAPGISSECDYYPASDLTIIVLSNFDRAASVVANYLRDYLHFGLN